MNDKKCILSFIIPMYNSEKYIADCLDSILKSDLPRDEYFKIIDTCSYAVFGTIRQQAMGNIRYALSKGIRVFLYKESVAFASLKSLGFVVYPLNGKFDSIKKSFCAKFLNIEFILRELIR